MASLTQLKYIIAVARSGHFGKAAEQCHVSQPSLSMQIQKVEEEIGYPLFDRKKKPVVPTKKGEVFIEQARRVLGEFQKLNQVSLETIRQPSGEFRLGIIPTLAPYLLPVFLESFSETYPKVDLYIEEMKTDVIISELRKDNCDAGILATPLKEKGIRERPLFYEPFYAYSSPSHEIHLQPNVHVSDLSRNHDIWLLQDGHCFKNQVLNLCSLDEETGVFKNVHFESGNLETIRYLIKKTKGYTLLPYLFVQTLPTQEQKTMISSFSAPIPTREVSLVHARDNWKKDVLEALYSSIKSNLPSDLETDKKDNIEIIEFNTSVTNSLTSRLPSKGFRNSGT